MLHVSDRSLSSIPEPILPFILTNLNLNKNLKLKKWYLVLHELTQMRRPTSNQIIYIVLLVSLFLKDEIQFNSILHSISESGRTTFL